jgi:ribose 1,5-bisphosphate isomerase
MDEHAVVTCFLRHGTDVLLVRRSEAVGTDRDQWGGVSGYAEGTPQEAARWEIAGEVGLLDTVDYVRSAPPLAVEDPERDTEWLVHPYLFDCESTAVTLNEELSEYEWVQPPSMLDRETVPRLWDAYQAVAPSVETVREDTTHGSAYISLRALEVLRDRAAAIAHDSGGYGTLATLARDLRAARPGMSVVTNRINRVMADAAPTPESVRDHASDACVRAVEADGRAASAAAGVVGNRVLTLSRSGTAVDTLLEAAPDAVFVAESRPDREGVSVAETLAREGLDVSLLVDAALGHVIAEHDPETVLLGADSVLADGTVLNKVGSRLAALAAADADADCYVVCSRDKIAHHTEAELPSGPRGAVYEGDAPLTVLNPTFEPVPPTLVDGIVTGDGTQSLSDVEAVADEHAALARWDE